MNEYLQVQKHPLTVVYFRANWNPQCRDTDKHAEKLAANNGGIQVIRVDSDVAPKIAKHYAVKYEPEFVFCLYGDEVVRQIGPSYQNLESKLSQVSTLAQETDLGDFDDKWVPYGTNFQVYYDQRLKELYKRYTTD